MSCGFVDGGEYWWFLSWLYSLVNGLACDWLNGKGGRPLTVPALVEDRTVVVEDDLSLIVYGGIENMDWLDEAMSGLNPSHR